MSERKSYEISPGNAKYIAEQMLLGKYSHHSVYSMAIGRKPMAPIVKDAIDAFLDGRKAAEITYETTLAEAAERFKKYGLDPERKVSFEDEAESQINPKVDAFDGRDISTSQAVANNHSQARAWGREAVGV